MGNTTTHDVYGQTILIDNEFPQNIQFQQQPPPPTRKIHKQAQRKPEQTKPQAVDKSLEFKNLGNQCIMKHQYIQAIDYYTKAIQLSPSVSIYFSNRAVALQFANRLAEAKVDAAQAIRLDENNPRGHYIFGTIQLRQIQQETNLDESLIKRIGEANASLDKAWELLKANNEESKQKLKASIKSNLGKGKRMAFLIAKEMDERNQSYLLSILEQSAKKRKIQFDWSRIQKIINSNSIQEVQVPDYYQCVITQEIMHEPILFNTGHTYELKSISTHFKTTNAAQDPITREPIDTQNAVHNIQIQQAIESLTSKYGWIGIEDEKDYKMIKFD